MKKILFMMAVALVAFTACQKQAQVEPTVYSVSDVYAQGDSLVGDTIMVEGVCMHLCKHGGKKAFLNSGVQGEFLRANATEFESFAGECVNNTLRVRGVLRAMELPAETKAEEEHHHAEGEEDCDVCSAVRKYYMDAVSYEIILNE